MSKFKVGDIVTWNDGIEDREKYNAIKNQYFYYGPGPFIITYVSEIQESINIKEIGGKEGVLDQGWYEWVFKKDCSILVDRFGFFWRNCQL